MAITTKQIRVFTRSVLSRTGLVSSGKVFCMGWGRTGTQSLNQLFEDFGMLSTHNDIWRFLRPQLQHYQYEFYCDCPPCAPSQDFRYFDHKFKNSKFILSVREQDKWLASRVKLVRLHVASGFSSSQPGWNDSVELLSEWLIRRNTYHLEIMKYFQDRPSDFLLVNFIRDKNAASTIADFVGFESHPKESPHKNKSRHQNKDQIAEVDVLVKDALKMAGIAENEWSNDIYSPSITEPELVGVFPSNTTEIKFVDCEKKLQLLKAN